LIDMMRLPSWVSAVLVAGTVALAACGEGTGPERSGQIGVGFRLAATPAVASVQSATGSATGSSTGAPTAPATAAPTPTGFSIKRGTDEILVTKAQVVVKDVKLKTVAVCDDDDDDDDDDKRKPGDDDDDDDCPTIRVGPFLVNVPVSGTDGGRVAVEVPAGTYSAVRFDIHKVSSSDSADRAFRVANPDFRDISIRLEGTFNGRAFTFVSDVNAKLDVPLTKPLTIGEGGDDVTVTIDMTEWFVRPSGGLYSPAEGNSAGFVRAKIQNNIRNAFRAFRDKDRDGKDDDDDR
jgi:hypothetical protein